MGGQPVFNKHARDQETQNFRVQVVLGRIALKMVLLEP